MTNTSGCAGQAEVRRRPGRVRRGRAATSSERARGEAATPAAHTIVRAATRSAPICTPSASTPVTGAPSTPATPRRLELTHGPGGEIGRIRGEDAGAGLDQDHARRVWIDAPEVAREACGARSPRGPRPSPPRSDRRRRRRRSATPAARSAILLALGLLEGQEHAPADLQGVVQRLEPGRMRRPSRRGRSRNGSRPPPRSGSRTRARRRSRTSRLPRRVHGSRLGQERRGCSPACRRMRADGRRRCRRERGRRSPPGRAAAGRGGGCGGPRP